MAIMTSHRRIYFLLLAISLCSDLSESNEQDDIPPYIAEQVRQAFRNGGVPDVKEKIFDNIDNWKDIEINIGVTGNSGVGKSSFINALRGLSNDDEGAAEVGVIETTKTATPYPHPQNEKLIIWDLPGIGTPNFPRDTYLSDVNADRFDYFIIMSADRFTENDLWLADNMKQKKKRFYFVRSKIDIAIMNNKRSHKKHNETDVLNKIRADCNKNLKDVMGSDKRVPLFLVDNLDTNMYDFSLLSLRLINDAPEMKKEALTLSLDKLSEHLIFAKKAVLSERIVSVSLLSAVAVMVPIPGLDVIVDIVAVLEEATFYRKQFGLDEESLKRYAKTFGMSVEEMTRKLDLQTPVIQFAAKGLIAYFARKGIAKTAAQQTASLLKYILPGVGHLASAATSYTSTKYYLEHLLNLMVEDALKVYKQEVQSSR